jgi:hypothetical protein
VAGAARVLVAAIAGRGVRVARGWSFRGVGIGGDIIVWSPGCRRSLFGIFVGGVLVRRGRVRAIAHRGARVLPVGVIPVCRLRQERSDWFHGGNFSAESSV